MKLVAGLLVKNELSRYLAPCVESLLTWVDEIRALDDASTDGSYEYLGGLDRVTVERLGGTFFEHEGRARNRLLDFTLAAEPSHVVAIDADELVTNGRAVRKACEGPAEVLMLDMQEVWCAETGCLCVRVDGGWAPRRIGPVFRVPTQRNSLWRIADRALACGREPIAVAQAVMRRKGVPVAADVLHLGWACQPDRAARHDRYVVADGGRFHASQHLDSIMWADERVKLEWRTWPAPLRPFKPALLERINQGAAETAT